MPRPPAPMWLTAPSRFAALSPIAARWSLALLALLLAACQGAISAPSPATHPGAPVDDQADVVLYDSVVSGVRAGGNYYAVTAAALRTGNYPLRPFGAFRLPTLAVVQSLLPPALIIGLLYALASAVLFAWFFRMREALARALPRTLALILLAGGMAAFALSALSGVHETWAGLLIALSLALRKPARWIDAAAFGMMAMLIRETAVLYVVVMAAAALIEGRRREAYGWIATLVVFALVVTLHAYAVSQVVRPLDSGSPGWSELPGPRYFVQTMTVSTALVLAPAWLAALLLGLTLFGWAAWRDPSGVRAIAMFGAYAALLGLLGRVDTVYWGLMIAPTLLIGLAFVPDGLRDLASAARNTRKITITRLTR